MSTAAVQSERVSVEDYLAAEARSETRRECLGGLVYAPSGGARWVDRQEKLFAYRPLETPREYGAIEPERTEATVYRRDHSWTPEMVAGQEAMLALNSPRLELSLKQACEGL